MALPRTIMAEFQSSGKRMVYPSLSTFLKEFKANQSAVIRAIRLGVPYKGIKLSYLAPGELKKGDAQYFVESAVGYEVHLAQFSNNNEMLLRIFNLVLQNKNALGSSWFALLNALQLCLNFLNLDNVDIGE